MTWLLLCLAPAAVGLAAPELSLSAAADASARAELLLADGHTGAIVQDLQEEVARAIREVADRLAPDAGAGSMMSGEAGEGQVAMQGTRTTRPEMPSEESVLPAGEWAVGRLREGGGAGAWQPELPPADLKRISDAFAAGRLPVYYRERLYAYGRSLAAEGGQEAGE
jgi:hypothetical protein